MINELWVLLADMSNLTSSASTELYRVGKLVKFWGLYHMCCFLNLQTLKFKWGCFILLVYQKVPISNLQSNFFLSRVILIVFKVRFNRSIFFVRIIFWWLQFLKHFLKSCPIFDELSFKLYSQNAKDFIWLCWSLTKDIYI